MVYHHDGGNSITQRLCWDEINRLIATSDGSQISHYIYYANGERAMKYNGTLSKIQQNKYTLVDCASMGQFTYYINPLMTVSTQEYTKHYFIEGQRVMSKIGAGMANNLMDMEDGAYDYIMSALSDSIKNQLAASFECLSLDGIAVFNTSIEPILEMANQNNHEFLRYFYHPDHLGSSSFITDATGEPTQHLEYLPFGELFIEERSTWNTPYKFSGKELDDETGYSYFGARYYDPGISIWLSVDPLSDKYPGYSPYNYTLNNPIRLIDPDGSCVISGWPPTRQWNEKDAIRFAKYSGSEISRMKAAEEESDCADLAVKFLIRYAASEGLEVAFTSTYGKSINSSTAQTDTPNEFEEFVMNNTNAKSLSHDMVTVLTPLPGDMTNDGVHINIVTEPDKDALYGINSIPTTSGSLPARIPRSSSVSKHSEFMRWKPIEASRILYMEAKVKGIKEINDAGLEY